MRWFLSLLVLGLFAVANALSSSGNRLLVVLEEIAEKEKYSKFFGDLEGQLERPSEFYVQFLQGIYILIIHHRARIQNQFRISKGRRFGIIQAWRESLRSP